MLLKYGVPPLCLLAGLALAFAVTVKTAGGKQDETVGSLAASYWDQVVHGRPADPALADPEERIEIGPITTNLRKSAKGKFIQLGFTLKTRQSRLKDVELMKADIKESVTMFLRGLDGRDLQGTQAMRRFKGQLERRVALIDTQNRISDISIHHLVLQ